MFKRTKHLFAGLMVFVSLLLVSPAALALDVTVDGTKLAQNVNIYDSTTYVPLRAFCNILCPQGDVSWSSGQAYVTAPGLNIVARPGDCYISANGRAIYAQNCVRLVNNTTLVPVRVLAKAFGAEVTWNDTTRSVTVGSASGYIESDSNSYNSDELYWLSRIIQAESGGEPMNGKIGVGNVILNRVACDEFPDSIYGVIFDKKWGVQFQPVSSGTIYNNPSAESILAAKMCLDGTDVVGEALYFLNPGKATSMWIVESRSFITNIGGHDFYS